MRGITPGTCPGCPGDAAELVCEKKSAKKKSRFLLKFFASNHVFSSSTSSRRSMNPHSQVRERMIRAFEKINPRIIWVRSWRDIWCNGIFVLKFYYFHYPTLPQRNGGEGDRSATPTHSGARTPVAAPPPRGLAAIKWKLDEIVCLGNEGKSDNKRFLQISFHCSSFLIVYCNTPQKINKCFNTFKYF